MELEDPNGGKLPLAQIMFGGDELSWFASVFSATFQEYSE